MDIVKARQIYAIIKASKHRRFADSLITSAIRYAQIRADWYQLSVEGRLELDRERSLMQGKRTKKKGVKGIRK
jgi:hypothetical protein